MSAERAAEDADSPYFPASGFSVHPEDYYVSTIWDFLRLFSSCESFPSTSYSTSLKVGIAAQPLSSREEMDLPIVHLSEEPTRHPDCCLSFSRKLFELLVKVSWSTVPEHQPLSVLSIGSGTGLLEALLQDHAHSNGQTKMSIEGVEVHSMPARESVNRYLSEQSITTVRGTWATSPRIRDSDVSTLLFVYPRQASLVSQYVRACFEKTSSVKAIVWLGPNADWDEFQHCLETEGRSKQGGSRSLEILRGEEAGLDSYEMMAVLRKESIER